MSLIYSSSLLEFFDSIPEFFAFQWVSFEVALYIVWHTFGEFAYCTRTYSVNIDKFLMVELVDEREDVPE